MTSFLDNLKDVFSVNKEKPFIEGISEKKIAEPEKKIQMISRDDKSDFKLLLSLYKQLKTIGDIDVPKLVSEVNLEATPHKCPFCSVVHDFTASRARKCPDCSNKMIVRQGLFITEQQADQLEKLINSFYEHQHRIEMVGHSLESAQDHKIQKEYVGYYLSMAEAFRYMALIQNKKDSVGHSFWDKAWSYYNQARMKEMAEMTEDMMEYTSLPSISWSMTQMVLEQAENESKEPRIQKGRRRSLSQAFMTLAEAAKFNTDPYYVTDIYTLATKQIEALSITENDLTKIYTDASSSMQLDKTALSRYEDWVQELKDYEVIVERD